MSELNREAALALMQEYVQSESLRRHMLCVAAAMRAYARKFGEDETTWGIVGQDIVEPLPDCNAGAAQQAPAQEEADDCESRYSMWEDRMMYCYGVNPN